MSKDNIKREFSLTGEQQGQLYKNLINIDGRHRAALDGLRNSRATPGAKIMYALTNLGLENVDFVSAGPGNMGGSIVSMTPQSHERILGIISRQNADEAEGEKIMDILSRPEYSYSSKFMAECIKFQKEDLKKAKSLCQNIAPDTNIYKIFKKHILAQEDKHNEFPLSEFESANATEKNKIIEKYVVDNALRARSCFVQDVKEKVEKERVKIFKDYQSMDMTPEKALNIVEELFLGTRSNHMFRIAISDVHKGLSSSASLGGGGGGGGEYHDDDHPSASVSADGVKPLQPKTNSLHK
jgi:hypothetical protein